MTSEQALKMAKAKLECIERQTSGKTEICKDDCESCSLCYEQGNMGEQKEWLKMAIKALEQESIQPKAKSGKWIKYGRPRCDEQHYQCTACNYYINFGKWGDLYTKEFRYCPNCGAKMESEE